MEVRHISDYELTIPACFQTPWESSLSERWEQTLANSDGAGKTALQVQCSLQRLLEGTAGKASFEKLAWMNLWARTYALVKGIVPGMDARETLLLSILFRTALETSLHVLFILEGPPKDKLRAYAAWCLWQDKTTLEKMLRGKILRAVYSPQPAKGFHENQDLAGFFSATYGEEHLQHILNVETDERILQKEMFEGRKRKRQELEQIEKHLASSELSSWARRLQDLCQETRNVSFFALCDGRRRSLYKLMESYDMEWMYVAYMVDSNFVHGSTLSHLTFGESLAVPTTFITDNTSVEESAEHIAFVCSELAGNLRVLKTFAFSGL